MQRFCTGVALFGCMSCMAGAVAQTAAPREQTALPVAAQVASPYQIEIDYSQTPELKDWVEKQLRPALEE